MSFSQAPRTSMHGRRATRELGHERENTLPQLDMLMDAMVEAIQKVKQAEGSIVSLPKAELDLLSQIEAARDVMQDVLCSQTDRTLLREMFGGSCTRIVRIRAICESMQFSDMNKGDQRLPTCLRACQSVEKVLIDLGDGEALKHAQKSLQTALKDGNSLTILGSLPCEVAQAQEPQLDLQEILSRIENSAEKSTERMSERLLADAERREDELRKDLARVTCNLQQIEERVDKQAQSLACADETATDMRSSLHRSQSQVEETLHANAQQREKYDALEARVARLEEKMEAMLGCSCPLPEKAVDTPWSNALSRLEEQAAVFAGQLSDITAGTFPQLQARVEALSKEVTAVAKEGVQHHDDLTAALDRAKEVWLEELVRSHSEGTARADESAALLASQQASLQTALELCSKDVERLRKALDLDPVWDSFAHVGGLIRDLQRRVDTVDGGPSTRSSFVGQELNAAAHHAEQ